MPNKKSKSTVMREVDGVFGNSLNMFLNSQGFSPNAGVSLGWHRLKGLQCFDVFMGYTQHRK